MTYTMQSLKALAMEYLSTQDQHRKLEIEVLPMSKHVREVYLTLLQHYRNTPQSEWEVA
jgi:hypothetical protein